MKVIAYIGVIGSGKDFTAKKDCDIQMAFADKLREDVWKMIGWKPKTETEYESFKIRQFEILPGSGRYVTGRQIMIGYAEVRRAENPEYFTTFLQTQILRIYKKAANEDVIVVGVPDCRYPIEVKTLKELTIYGIEVEFRHVNFKSDRYTVDPSHESEKLAIECLQFWGDNFAFQNYIEKI